MSGAREEHPHARSARTSELPISGVEARRLGQVEGLGDLGAVGEGQALRTGSRETEPDLAAGLQVEDVIVKRARVAARHQLGHRGELAFAHGGLDVGASRAFGEPAPAPELREQDVTLGAQLPKVGLERAHPLPDLGDAALDLGGLEILHGS